MARITDPTELKQLNGSRITDPAEVARLNAGDIHSAGDVFEQVMRKLAAGGSGVLRGAAGLAGLPGGIFNLAQTAQEKFLPWHPPARHMTDAEDIRNYADRLMHNIPGYAGVYEPQSTLEKYIQAGTEGAASMPGRGPSLALGAISGIAGEGADQASGGTPGARLAGNLAPFVAAGPVALKTPQLIKAILDSTKESLPMLTQAAASKAAADKALGVNTLLTNYMPQTGALPSVANDILRVPAGAGMRTAREAQNAAALRETQALPDSVSSLPLDATTQQMVSDTGNQVFRDIGATRRAATKPDYAASAPDLVSVQQLADALIKARAGTSISGTTAGNAMDKYLKQLEAMKSNTDFFHLPGDMVPVNNINTMSREAFKTAQPRIGADPAAVLGHTLAGSTLSAGAEAASPALKTANKNFEDFTQQFVEPATKGAFGQSFPKPGAVSTRDWETMNKYVGDKVAHPNDISDVASFLDTVNPEAYPALLKKFLVDSGGTPLDFVAKARGLSTDTNFPAMQDAFKAKMRANAISHGATGADADAAAEGANNLMTAVESVGTAEKHMPGGVQTEVPEKAGETLTGDVAKVLTPYGFVRTWFAVNKLESMVREKTLGEVADLFTSPDAIPKLIELAKYNPVDNAMGVISKALGSVGAQNAAPADSAATPPQLNVYGSVPLNPNAE